MNIRGSAPALTLLLVLAAIACTGRHPQEPKNILPDKPEKGKVSADIRCVRNNSVSYALYLPSTYDPALKWPVVFLFDPHGSGAFPVEKYKTVAEHHGCILAGSNNSKNGLGLNETGIIVQDLFEDVLSRFSIDSVRIYTAGFSGGSRIASLIALSQYGIAGVTGCGAGFPYSAAQPKTRFDYIGIAGTSDFNMNELAALDRELETAGFRHALILFDGIHAWPPESVMEEAFCWNDLNAMKDGKMKRDERLIREYFSGLNTRLNSFPAERYPLELHRELLNGIRFLRGMQPVDSLQAALVSLEKSAGYKKALRADEAIAQNEERQQKMLTDNFFVEKESWWKRTIDGYDRTIRTSTDSGEVRMCRRLKSYLSLVAYMSYTKVYGAGDTIAAGQAMRIYEMVDPENAAKTKAGNVK